MDQANSKNKRPLAKKGIKKRFGTFRKNADGSTMIEFSIILPVFLMLLFAILEVGYLFYADAMIESTMDRAARDIRTNNAPDKDYVWDTTDPNAKCKKTGKDCFYDDICIILDSFGDCDDKLSIDVQVFESFKELSEDLSEPVCANNENFDYARQAYDNGDQRDIVRIRLCWVYTPITPGLGLGLSNTPEGRHRIIATSVFQTEPYGRPDADDET